MTQSPADLELTASIVSAYVANNAVPTAELASLIASVASKLSELSGGSPAVPATTELKPAVPIKKSVTPDYLISLEDGRKFKSLKRALATRYGMTPDEYRAKWGLPHDYPMVAPNYSKARSELAKQIGLGQVRLKGDRGRPRTKSVSR